MIRRTILTVLGCLLLGTTVAQQRPQSGHEPAREGARMRLEHTSHDFGDVPRKGGDLVHEFRFRNEGTAPLVLIRVVTSCSCLKTLFPKRPVSPGEEGTIRITYEPHKSEPGVFNKVIQIYSNSTDGREILTVQGNSIEEDPRVKIKNDKIKIRN